MSHPSPPRDHYQERARQWGQRERRAERWHGVLGWARLVTALLSLTVAYQACARRSVGAAGVAVPVVAFVVLSVALARAGRERGVATDMREYYEAGLSRLDGVAGGTADGARYQDAGHPYAADLDLFGPRSLFCRLCMARTTPGQDALASWLLSGAEREEVLGRQAAVAELRDRVELRAELWRVAGGVTEEVRATNLGAWVGAAGAPPSTTARIAALALSVLGAGAVAAILLGRPLLAVPIAIVLIAFSSRYRSLTAAVASGAQKRAAELSALGALAALIESESFSSERMLSLQRALRTGDVPAARRIAELVRRVDWFESRRNPFFGLISAPVLLGTQLAFAIEVWRLRHGEAVVRWIRVVAEVEALISLATYAFEHPAHPFPEVVPESDGPVFQGRAVGHPLIPEPTRVGNDVALDPGVRMLLVSGSNMSGKSTLLRTVGINVVLALAGAPVCAAELRVCRLAIGATLRTSDSLDAGVSRFFAEIQRIRTIVGMTEQSAHTLYLFDEVLQGTNSQDRFAGAAAILRTLVSRGAIGLVTTHDLSLARIVDDLAPAAANVHFEDRIEDGKLLFDYRLRPGIVTRSNALALMKLVGLPV